MTGRSAPTSARHVVWLHGDGRTEAEWGDRPHVLAPTARHRRLRGDLPAGAGFTWVQRAAAGGFDAAEMDAAARRLDRRVADITASRPLLVGYSRGATIAAALLWLRPDAASGAILFRPEPPYRQRRFPPLRSLPILILSGRSDDHRRPDDAAELARRLRQAGARVTHHDLDTGHDWADDNRDLVLARNWLATLTPAGRARWRTPAR